MVFHIIISFMYYATIYDLFCNGERIFDEENIPVKHIVTISGKTVDIPCPGISQDSLVDSLLWKTNGVTVAKYVNGETFTQNERISLSLENFTLYFKPVLTTDTAEYTCLINDRQSPEYIVDLLVQDVPDPPERPLVTSFTSRSVNLSWAHSQFFRNAPVTNFEIETKIGEEGSWSENPKIITNSSRATFHIKSLQPFTVYSFRVIAINSIGRSKPSKPSYYIVTLREAPTGKPVTTVVHNTSSSSIYISWKPPPFDTILGEFLGYRITYRARDNSLQDVKEIYIRDNTVESHEITGLETYTQYLISVQVFNPEGLGPPTTVLTMTDEGIPEKPQNLSVLEVTSTTIKIKWHEPLRLNGAIHGYRVYSVSNNQTVLHIPLFKPDPESGSGPYYYTLMNLKPFTEYKIHVTAVTRKYDGEQSDPLIQRTDVSGPSPPVIVNLTCSSTDSVYLRWRRPLTYYNTIDLYAITFRDLGSNEFKTIKIDNSSASHTEIAMVLSNLTSNTIYEMKVRAASFSTINPKQLILGSYSEPKKIDLHPNCEKIQSLLRQSQDDFNMIYVIGIGFSIFGMIIIVLAVVLWRHCAYSPYYYIDVPSYKPQQMSAEWNAPADVGGEMRGPISISEFCKHTASLHVDGDIGFSKEYEAIQNECIADEHSSEYSLHPENKAKNRYLNITAYDHTRVRLRLMPGQNKNVESYINANFIDGYNQSRAFIGTQGPLPGTFDCFWRMIWEQQVVIIVMITNLIERGRRKCDMYWPREGTETYGVISVTLLEENVLATYTVRSFSIKHLKLKKKKGRVCEKTVYQYHYTNWPDHGTSDPLPVLNFIKKSASANPTNAGPIVVHCSAGVGRTGTYIVLDAMLKQIKEQQMINIFGFLRHIRKQRNFLVQTEEQYIFIHDALNEAIICGETSLNRNDILNMTTNHDLIQHQFVLITSYKPKDINFMSATKNINLPKNRGTLIPVESSRVHLTPKPGQEGSDYINASWLHGFRRLRDFIVTQHPLPNTIKDFWQMIWDHNIQTIILLTFLDEQFTPFWPNEAESFDGDYYRLKTTSESCSNNYIQRKFSLQSLQGDFEMFVNMYHSPNWPDLSQPESVYDFIQKIHERPPDYKYGPIVVVDRYGGAHACTFCMISTLAMELEYDNTANVFMHAKLYHNKRPGIWTSMEDIRHIYSILYYCPNNLNLLQATSLRTEFEDVAVATPDLFSKICSNGSISRINELNNSANSGKVLVKINGENDEISTAIVNDSCYLDNNGLQND